MSDTLFARSTRQSAAGSCAATALLELCILAPAHPPERECRMSRGCRQRAHGGMRERERCRAGRRREPRAECASARACPYCTPACECPCMSRDRHASVLCRLSAEVVSVRVSGWRGSPPPCPPRVRDYYSTIQPYMYSYEESAVPLQAYKALSARKGDAAQTQSASSRHLPLSPPLVG